tara:strand:- start:3487 stop:4251 length:765 start_codon:yes stop_codon:yes gene_type:complete
MKNFFFVFLIFSLLFSCSQNKNIIYLSDINERSLDKIDSYFKDNIEIGDILKIDINSAIPEVSVPYNNLSPSSIDSDINSVIINGYLVDVDSSINIPVLGKIKVVGNTEGQLAFSIKKLLDQGKHLSNPYVKVKKVNSKFTVLGEVKNPGTFSFYDNKLNIFQALGFAGDLLITAKKNNVKLLREENGLRKTYTFSLNNTELLDKPYYYIKSNDVIIIDPNFSKIKSAGFIGSPASIASISQIVLSITLLLINR